MGYGHNLKAYLDEKHMRVPKLATITGISKHTIYTLIKRDTPVRYDYALKIAYALDIPISSICNTDPYTQGLEYNPKDKEKRKAQMEDTFHRCFINSYILPVLMLLGKESKDNLSIVQSFLEKYYRLSDEERREILLYMDFLAERRNKK